MSEQNPSGYDGEVKSRWDYLAIVQRRNLYFVLSAMAILAATVVITFGQSPVYRSTGKILIEQQGIPRERATASVTSYAYQRIQAISQRALTTDNLTRVVEKLNLFTKARREQPMEEIIQRMRDSFGIEMTDAEVRDPHTGRSGIATIAVSVSFEHESPAVAQKVANDLGSLYLEENVKSRTQGVAKKTRFLDEEAERLAAQLSNIEGRIAEFNKKNMGHLPEQQDLSMQLMQRAEEALVETQHRIQSKEGQKTYLASALGQMRNRPAGNATTDPSKPDTSLPSLRAQYARLSGIYVDDCPDVARVRREISALQVQLGRAPEITTPDEGQELLLVKSLADPNTIETELETRRQQEKKCARMVQSIEQRLAKAPRTEQEAPIKPGRFKFLLLGFTGSFVGGFGAMFLRKGIGKSVRSARTVSETTNAPVLGAIPRIETAADRRRMRRNRVFVVLLLLICVAAAVAAVYFDYQPLDSLWSENV